VAWCLMGATATPIVLKMETAVPIINYSVLPPKHRMGHVRKLVWEGVKMGPRVAIAMRLAWHWEIVAKIARFFARSLKKSNKLS